MTSTKHRSFTAALLTAIALLSTGSILLSLPETAEANQKGKPVRCWVDRVTKQQMCAYQSSNGSLQLGTR
ncbi:hypothetical protein PCC6311_0538 [Synechococcus elongatus PCC 6311]|uniref:hypothetical protein n=1 Tax=Synechococcus elongatus TaxID=32046 RepID=UPI0005A0C0A1|nr:hypothetical protein [Synechococcus elongatus]UOW70311.1 hypothetical protein PCC7943_0538 [Synechococcus elongatus PCC 7943]UOW73032.1 hypothetical protein PCC6311_0538 [Synechococcus elongatus PCC 6311]UOW75753.1 hypothetical protein PCC6301pg_0538 [Synechococcus elongatus PCC 6301]